MRAIRAGDRRAIARTITRIESTRDADRALGQAVLDALVADWVRRGIATRPSLPVGTVPPGRRLMPLDQFVADLARDREER